MTIVRFFYHKVLDMLELYIVQDTFRTLDQFKNAKCAVGLKPMIAFSGTLFESPTPNAYTMAKSMFLDMFKGADTPQIDVEGLQYLIQISVGEEIEGQPKPAISFRVYRIKTKRSGQKLPRIEVEEMGPRIDFRIGRLKESEESVMKEALKRPRQLEVSFPQILCSRTGANSLLQPKTKKNVETDLMGDKVGRIHIGKQDLSTLQARKMKGLKRQRDEVESGGEESVVDDDEEEVIDEPASKKQR